MVDSLMCEAQITGGQEYCSGYSKNFVGECLGNYATVLKKN